MKRIMNFLFASALFVALMAATGGEASAQSAQQRPKVKFKREAAAVSPSANGVVATPEQTHIVFHFQYYTLSEFNALSEEMKEKVRNNPKAYVYADGLGKEKAALQRKQGVPSLIVPSSINSPSKK